MSTHTNLHIYICFSECIFIKVKKFLAPIEHIHIHLFVFSLFHSAEPGRIEMATSTGALRVLIVLLGVVLMTTTEAVRIETFNGPGCRGSPTNVFLVGRNQCQTFIDQGSVRLSDIAPDVRVSFHNQRNCRTASSVGQQYGPVCLSQGATKLRAVYVA